jgi:signal transduction histidine kinase
MSIWRMVRKYEGSVCVCVHCVWRQSLAQHSFIDTILFLWLCFYRMRVEVRNPLSSALSACSFLENNHCRKGNDARKDDSDYNQITEDLTVISSSLAYINDLLRSLLDTNKIACGQLTLHVTPTDIVRDILEPVKSMLHHRDTPFSFYVDCPHGDLVVPVDRLPIKQVILNLASNAKKFVKTGFIRLTARVLEDGTTTRLTVEDSGTGIPETKRKHLFEQFQESLDELHQGTGMGLSLCQSLVQLMDGSLYLDESYHSGIEGFAGAKFVIDLPVAPVGPDTTTHSEDGREVECPCDLESGTTPSDELLLPSDLTVLLIGMTRDGNTKASNRNLLPCC